MGRGREKAKERQSEGRQRFNILESWHGQVEDLPARRCGLNPWLCRMNVGNGPCFI